MREEVDNNDRRNHLGFTEAAARHIEPLLASFGFRCTGSSCYVVEYSSPNVLLDLVHDRLSYGIGAEFQRIDDPNQRCSLGGLLTSKGEAASFQASTPQAVDVVIKKIAGLLRQYGANVLSGDAETYQRLVDETADRSKEYTREVVQHPVREAAENAWKNRDYAKVHELYGSIESDLTPVERGRLEYAASKS